MTPTRGQVKTRFLSLLDDPGADVFIEPVFAEAFGEAYDALLNAFLVNQAPRIELLQHFTAPAGTTELTAGDMGISDLGDYRYLAERSQGNTGRYREMIPVQRLQQRGASNTFREFVYRDDTFYLAGNTQPVELEIAYDASGVAPTADTVVIRVDNSLTFLANYAAGIAGPRKGYDQEGARCMLHAVGPAYDQNRLGGELFRLVQTRVRSKQKIPIAPRPFSASRRYASRRAVPYVEAQPGTTS